MFRPATFLVAGSFVSTGLARPDLALEKRISRGLAWSPSAWQRHHADGPQGFKWEKLEDAPELAGETLRYPLLILPCLQKPTEG